MLLEMIEARTDEGLDVLDIGSGIGVIALELLKTRASRAVLVEATPTYVEAARQEARQAGVADRVELVAGDFVRHAAEIDTADVVTLDRVVCCYPDADALVSASAPKSRRLYGLVLPRDRWYVRLAIRVDNIRWWLKRRAYRAHAHANVRIDALVSAHGLRPVSEAFTLVWRVVLYARDGTDRPLARWNVLDEPPQPQPGHPSTSTASSSPGQGGIVTPTIESGSVPNARNWKSVPSGIVRQVPSTRSTISARPSR
jgi:magnesium-protoporphyrin O-methyltransferase